MFRFMRSNLLVLTRDFLNGDSTKTLFIIIRSISTDSNNNKSSFTVSYLINSCNLPAHKAISASKKVHFNTSSNPDSVLTLLRNYGFTNTHISQIIEKLPSLLKSKVQATVKPKLDYFLSLGFSHTDLPHIISANPYIMKSSLENHIVPTIDYIKTLVPVHRDFISMLRGSTLFLTHNVLKYVEPNMSLLRTHGVPDSNISRLLVARQRTFFPNTTRFKEMTEKVKRMGFVPSQYTFGKALTIFTSMSESTIETKFEVFRRWGWSDNMIYKAIKSEPTCITLSVRLMMLKMDIFVNKMGYDPLLIAKYPGVLKYSVEKRIIPRCSVIQLLLTNGLIKKETKLYSILRVSDEAFLNTFVTKYEKEVPHLVDTFQGR